MLSEFKKTKLYLGNRTKGTTDLQIQKFFSKKKKTEENKQNLREQNTHCGSLRRREREMGREVTEKWLQTS